MNIVEATAWEAAVPLLPEWASSEEIFGPHGHAGESRLILSLTDEDGRIGWGESPMPTRPIVETALAMLCGPRVWRLNQIDLWDPRAIYWSRPLPPSPFAACPSNIRHRLRHPMQSAAETALTDLRAQRLGVSFSEMFGGRWRECVATDYWMGRVTPDDARRCVRRARSLGFRGVKLKTTLEDPNVERLEAIREEAGADFHVTVDPNGRFYRLDDALSVIRRMEAVGNLQILEDPFPRFHLEEFAELRKRIEARVVVHIDPDESLWDVLQSGAAGGLNIDSKISGPFQWRMLAGVAEQANLSIWHGSSLDLGIATAAQLHLAASAPSCRLPGDQAGPWLREHTLTMHPFEVSDGMVRVPNGPGLGIEIDPAALDRYTLWSSIAKS